MLNNIDTTICEWDEAQFLFFSDNIWGDFIYYSHLLPAVSALVVTLFVYFNARSNKAAQALLVTGISFATWTFMGLFLGTLHSTSQVLISQTVGAKQLKDHCGKIIFIIWRRYLQVGFLHLH